jgi:hypothetical protein
MRYCQPLMMIAVIIAIGSIFFYCNEDWTFVQAMYMCFVTTTTVGYGDMLLKHRSSKIFLIFYIPISVSAIAAALGSFTSINIEVAAEKKRIVNLKRKLDFNMIREMDTNGDGIDKCEFLCAMLIQNELCDIKDIEPWLLRFDELDKDHSGKLDEEDIRILEEEEEKRMREIQQLLPDDAEEGEAEDAADRKNQEEEVHNPIAFNNSNFIRIQSKISSNSNKEDPNKANAFLPDLEGPLL